MKNKIMRTAGLLLASTTMLMANGVVAEPHCTYVSDNTYSNVICMNLSGMEPVYNQKGDIVGYLIDKWNNTEISYESEDGKISITVKTTHHLKPYNKKQKIAEEQGYKIYKSQDIEKLIFRKGKFYINED